MRQPLLEDEVERVVGSLGAEVVGPGVEGLEVEGGDVGAGDVLGEVGGAQDQASVDSLHAVIMPSASDSPGMRQRALVLRLGPRSTL